MTDRVKAASTAEGWLDSMGARDKGWVGDFVFWKKGTGEACLHGYFSAADLRAIADHMEGK